MGKQPKRPLQLAEFFWEYGFIGLYLLVLIISLIRFPLYFDTPLRYLPIFLAYTLFTEGIGLIVRDNEEYSVVIREFYYNNNWLIYNLYGLFFTGFFIFVYNQYNSGRHIRQFIRIGVIAYLLGSVVNAFLDDFATVSQVYSYGIGGMLLIILSLDYLVRTVRQKGVAAPWRNLLVWLSGGILVFNLAYIPIKFIRYMVSLDVMENYAWVRPVHLGGIYFMYGAFFIGFAIMVPLKKPRNGNRFGAENPVSDEGLHNWFNTYNRGENGK